MGIEIAIDPEFRALFGCSYPVTYDLAIPPGAEQLSTQVRYGDGTTWGVWLTLPEISGNNGVAKVRYDYPNNRAYVSVGFDHLTSRPAIQIRALGPAGDEAPTTLHQVSNYYDNRDYAVSISWDDWDGGPEHEAFMAAALACQTRGIWSSVGINAGGRIDLGNPALSSFQWAEMQSVIDGGFLEPSNHHYHHRHPESAVEADLEIGANVDAITGNVTMPWQSRMGSEQFVLGHIKPNGLANTLTLERLASAGLVGQRNAAALGGAQYWTTWLSSLSVYDGIAPGNDFDTHGQITLRGRFDEAAAAGGIYVGYGHPYLYDGYPHAWEQVVGVEYDWNDPNDRVVQQLDYIAGRPEAWYAPLGHLFVYRLVAEQATVVTAATSSPATGTVASGRFVPDAASSFVAAGQFVRPR